MSTFLFTFLGGGRHIILVFESSVYTPREQLHSAQFSLPTCILPQTWGRVQKGEVRNQLTSSLGAPGVGSANAGKPPSSSSSSRSYLATILLPPHVLATRSNFTVSVCDVPSVGQADS